MVVSDVKNQRGRKKGEANSSVFNSVPNLIFFKSAIWLSNDIAQL